MVKFYDISAWVEHKYFSTGGTRNKVVVENPADHERYFFKTSLKRIQKDYTYEFWSEIIASGLGEMLGFNILHYDAAYNKGQLGCLSKSMIDPSQASLQEGYRWLTGYSSSYDVEDREAYTFQIMEEMLSETFPDNSFIGQLIETLIFDAVIGNEDRHQENWGIIVSSKTVMQATGFWKKKTVEEKRRLFEFAPIYDSGSSLGRELTEDKVAQMNKDMMQIEAYVGRGKSEVHWKGETGKQKHFDLIRKISAAGHRENVIQVILRVKDRYKEEAVRHIIANIDDCLPSELAIQKIPDTRKELIIKLVSLRIKRLIGLLYEI